MVLPTQGSSLGSVFRDTDKQESIDTVLYALKHGVNLIDTAPWYGHGKAETVLGEALKSVPREAYILTTKVGRYLPDPMEMFDFTAERVTKSVDESLARLGVDYIDVIQVHDPEFCPYTDIIVEETLPALVKLQEQGKVKMIGMTGTGICPLFTPPLGPLDSSGRTTRCRLPAVGSEGDNLQISGKIEYHPDILPLLDE